MAHTTKTVEGLQALNTLLAHQNYINGDLPGQDDNTIFEEFQALTNQQEYPEVNFWYLTLINFAPPVRAQWGAKGAKKDGKPEQQQAVPAAQKKDENEVDLFGDDDTPAPVKVEAPKPPQKKKAVIAKTIVIFDVKVYEAEDPVFLESIAQKIRAEVNQDGLVWAKEHKIIEVAFGAKKLQMTMIIEDDKVGTEDVFEKILAWEDDVQSVDVDQMQKV